MPENKDFELNQQLAAIVTNFDKTGYGQKQPKFWLPVFAELSAASLTASIPIDNFPFAKFYV